MCLLTAALSSVKHVSRAHVTGAVKVLALLVVSCLLHLCLHVSKEIERICDMSAAGCRW